MSGASTAGELVWGGSRPLPPPLCDGWCYVVPGNDFLQVRGPSGGLFFVARLAGEYVLHPRKTALVGRGSLAPGEVYADTDEVLPLPIREPFAGEAK